MSQILVDSISTITIHNGVLRIECHATGADGQNHVSGTLVIPGAAANRVMNELIGGMQQLEKKLVEQTAPAAPQT